MATYKELNRKRKEILLNMKPEEIEVLYNEINKKVIDSLGTVRNNYSYDYETIIKANEELEETNRILKTKYPTIEALGSSTRLNLLIEKYEELTTEAKELEFSIIVVTLASMVMSLRNKINYLKSVLYKFYFRYSFRTSNLDNFLIDELGVPEDIVLVTLEPYVYYTTAFFSKSLEKDFNFFIESLVKDIDFNIAKLDNYLAVKIEPSNYTDEAIIKTMEELIQLQIMATTSIKQYEEIKLNPFEEAVNVEAEFKVNTFNKLVTSDEFKTTFEEEKEFLLRRRPSYNFDSFELIVPDIDLKAEAEKSLKESIEKHNKGAVN